jgi:L-asparaginase/Glu-tRNA(Gln) amidotransferase subunit D
LVCKEKEEKFMLNESLKILVIATGGTIGSVTKGGIRKIKETHGDIINTKTISQDNFLLTKLYTENCCHKQEFVIKEPYCILSENLDLDFLQRLIDSFVKYLNEDKYCGVVITHGTDTLGYTKSIFKHLDQKVYIDIPIEFAYAYNPIPKDEQNGQNIANWDGYKRFKEVVNRICNKSYVKNKEQKKIILDEIKLQKTLIIKIFPSIDFSIYDLKDKQYNNIILEGYHSCTVPVEQTMKLIDKTNAEIFVCSPEAFTEKYSSIEEIEKYAESNAKKIKFVTGDVKDIWAMLTLGLKL